MRIKITIETDETGAPIISDEGVSVTMEGAGDGKGIAVETPVASAGEARISDSSASPSAISTAAEPNVSAAEAIPISDAGVAPLYFDETGDPIHEDTGTASDSIQAMDESEGAAAAFAPSSPISAGPPALESIFDVEIGEFSGELVVDTAVSMISFSESDETDGGDERCQGITKSGKQCKNKASAGSMYCYAHQGN